MDFFCTTICLLHHATYSKTLYLSYLPQQPYHTQPATLPVNMSATPSVPKYIHFSQATLSPFCQQVATMSILLSLKVKLYNISRLIILLTYLLCTMLLKLLPRQDPPLPITHLKPYHMQPNMPTLSLLLKLQ